MSQYNIVSAEAIAQLKALIESGDIAAIKQGIHAVVASARDPEAGLFTMVGTDQSTKVFVRLPVGFSIDAAKGLINAAIIETNRETQQGANGNYFETLQEKLAAHHIDLRSEPESLHTRYAWDSDCVDVLGEDLSERTSVAIDNVASVLEHQDDDMLIGTVGESGEAVQIDPSHVNQIRVFEVDITYPRADRYGVPECATDTGARKYLADLGFIVASNLEVNTEDSGDDSAITIEVKAYVRDEHIQRLTPREGPQG